MKYFHTLIKPASSICNMRCKYCFYDDVSSNRETKNYGRMNNDNAKILIDKVLNMFNEDVTITFAFQGGEPTCAGLKYFEFFVSYVKEVKRDYHIINYAIQTNGYSLEKKWYKFFEENNFLVGISIDGFKAIHDKYRLNINGKGTFDSIINTMNNFKNHKIEFNVLTVLNSTVAKYPKELFNFYKDYNIRYVQLIPCLPNLDEVNNKLSLTPQMFYKFYNEFFRLWYKEFKRGNYISVTLFDNLIPMFIGKRPSQCGYLGQCNNQCVVEGNGDVFPCDFYVLDKYKTGNITKDDINDILNSKVGIDFINEKRKYSKKCPACKYQRICYGQCKRLSVCYYDENYCGYQHFIESNIDGIMDVCKSIRRY